MSERKRILDLIDRAYRADAWHGPAMLETLDGVNAALAAKRPPRGANSIWQLVEHVASWNDIVARRLAGELPKVPPEFNFPPVPKKPTPAKWKASQRRLARTHARFRKEVARFPVAKLGRRRPKTNQTWNVLIHGQVQHVLYHAGQIAILRRMYGKPVKSH
jgi:uncharacterized damage-inducible protein DinB